MRCDPFSEQGSTGKLFWAVVSVTTCCQLLNQFIKKLHNKTVQDQGSERKRREPSPL